MVSLHPYPVPPISNCTLSTVLLGWPCGSGQRKEAEVMVCQLLLSLFQHAWVSLSGPERPCGEEPTFLSLGCFVRAYGQPTFDKVGSQIHEQSNRLMILSLWDVTKQRRLTDASAQFSYVHASFLDLTGLRRLWTCFCSLYFRITVLMQIFYQILSHGRWEA